MADISITDQVNMTASVQIRDDSPLALANLKKLRFTSLPSVGDFGKPLDGVQVEGAELGTDVDSPGLPLGTAGHFAIAVGVAATFSIYAPKREALFGDDEYAPRIDIRPNECWAGFSIQAKIDSTVHLPAVELGLVELGVVAKADRSLVCGTFVRFPEAGAAMPTFKDGIARVLDNFSIPHTAEQIRAIPVGVAHTFEIDGSISLGAAYSAPLQVNPLATLAGPLNFAVSITPNAGATVRAAVVLDGAFVVRIYRSAPNTLIIGVYKKQQTTLSASLAASAGMGADVGGKDVSGAILDAVVPGEDLHGLDLDDLQPALKACVDQSVSIALNACCSASTAPEAAVVYELDLSPGLGMQDTQATDEAIESALKGDWSPIGMLANARLIRNIVGELRDRNHRLTIHLLGIYNAASIADFLRSSTVLHDEHGQISIVDRVSAKQLSAGTEPYAAKGEKLRSALSQAVVATVAYGASALKIKLTSFEVRQSMLEYKADASGPDLMRQILIARSVGLSLNPQWDALAKANSMFNHNQFSLNVRYDARSVMGLFYRDVENRIPHPPEDLDRMGRDVKIALLNPSAVNSMQRRMALANDNIWNAMNKSGNIATFKLIPGLAKLSVTAIAAISADFVDIRWWSNAMQSLTPRLTTVLQAIDESRSGDVLHNEAFLSARSSLEAAMGSLISKTQGTFGEGWGLAVMYRLAKSTAVQSPSVQMDIGWNRQFEHFEAGMEVAVGQTGGA